MEAATVMVGKNVRGWDVYFDVLGNGTYQVSVAERVKLTTRRIADALKTFDALRCAEKGLTR